MKANNFMSNEKAQGDIVGLSTGGTKALITLAIILVIGVVIVNGVVDGANLAENDSMYTTLQTIISSINTAFVLAGIVMLVVVAVVILGLLGYI